MRIITGTARGFHPETLPGEETRPTTDRVKEGMFNAVQFDIEGRHVLDAFAGSGQLGLEALSRGAADCVFVDKNAAATEVIRRNLKGADLAAQAQVFTGEMVSYLAHTQESFDLVFLDPPYAAALLTPALSAVAPHLSAGALVVCEGDAALSLPTTASLTLVRTYRYGRVQVWLFRKE